MYFEMKSNIHTTSMPGECVHVISVSKFTILIFCINKNVKPNMYKKHVKLIKHSNTFCVTSNIFRTD